MVLLHIFITSRDANGDTHDKAIPSHIHIADKDLDWYRKRNKKILQDLVTIVVDNIDIIERKSKDEKDCITDASGLMHLEPCHENSEIVISFSTRPKAKKLNYILMTLDDRVEDNPRSSSSGSSTSSSSSAGTSGRGERDKPSTKKGGNITATINSCVPQGSTVDMASFALDIWIYPRDVNSSMQILPTDAGVVA